MPVTVRIPTPLRQVTKGNAEVSAKGATVDDLVADLERQFPGLKERLVDESGELRRFINIYAEGRRRGLDRAGHRGRPLGAC